MNLHLSLKRSNLVLLFSSLSLRSLGSHGALSFSVTWQVTGFSFVFCLKKAFHFKCTAFCVFACHEPVLVTTCTNVKMNGGSLAVSASPIVDSVVVPPTIVPSSLNTPVSLTAFCLTLPPLAASIFVGSEPVLELLFYSHFAEGAVCCLCVSRLPSCNALMIQIS